MTNEVTLSFQALSCWDSCLLECPGHLNVIHCLAALIPVSLRSPNICRSQVGPGLPDEGVLPPPGRCHASARGAGGRSRARQLQSDCWGAQPAGIPCAVWQVISHSCLRFLINCGCLAAFGSGAVGCLLACSLGTCERIVL